MILIPCTWVFVRFYIYFSSYFPANIWGEMFSPHFVSYYVSLLSQFKGKGLVLYSFHHLVVYVIVRPLPRPLAGEHHNIQNDSVGGWRVHSRILLFTCLPKWWGRRSAGSQWISVIFSFHQGSGRRSTRSYYDSVISLVIQILEDKWNSRIIE